MKVYPPKEGLTYEELKAGHWILYVDLKCEDCGKELAASYVGGIGGKCPKCGGRMI